MTKDPDVKVTKVSELRVKTETFPDRCEICHQTDHFDPETNSCLRCDAYNLPNKIVSITHNYSTARAIFTAASETVLGGFAGLFVGATAGIIILNFLEEMLGINLRIGGYQLWPAALGGFFLGITILEGDKKLILKSIIDLTLWAMIGMVVGLLTTAILGFSKAMSSPIEIIFFGILVGACLRRIYTLTGRYRKSLPAED
jgi:hypothetical protein